jgi:hypothetical protein
MAELLTSLAVSFTTETKFANHRIDFTLEAEDGSLVLWDVNGDWWHSKAKIVQCDRVKIERVVAAGGLPLGVFWTRLSGSPESVATAVRRSLREPRVLPWWDWKVPIEALSLPAQRTIRAALSAGSGLSASSPTGG